MKRTHRLILVAGLILSVFAGCTSGGGGSDPLSDAKAITAFALYTSPTASSPIALGTVNESDKTIAVTVPFGTNVTALVAGFITSGSSVSVNGVNQVNRTTPNDFTNTVAYVVTAGNGSTVTYKVTVTKAPGDAKAITAFALTTGATGSIPDAIGIINEPAKTIAVTVPYGTNVINLIATFITTGVSVTAQGATQNSGSTHVDFTNPVVYRVTAGDATFVDYTVTVTIAPSSSKTITAFSLLGIPGTINEGAKTIAVTVPYGTNVTALVATFATTGALVSVNTTTQVSGSTANNFTNSVDYIVTAANGSTATYAVTVTIASGSEKAITSFLFTSPSATGTINEDAKTIDVTVPHGTDVTALVATFTTTGTLVSIGTITQVSGLTSNDFTHPLIYTVTAADTSTVTYTVTVTITPDPAGVVKLPKTGQTICTDGTTTVVIACAGTGQDGDLQKGVAWPSPRFTTNADTSVTDNLTGLVWAPDGNLMPARDSGWDTDGTADDGKVTWQHALDYVAKLNAENYLGHNDWRLPNRKELRSLVNYSQFTIADWLNTQGFSKVGYAYWSSTSVAFMGGGGAWLVNMYDGYVPTSYGKTNNFSVWPVRAGQGSGAPAELPKTGQTICYDYAGTVITCTNTGQDGALQKGVAWPSPRFAANADTSVTDYLTGLVWAPNGNLMPTRDSGWDTDGTANDGRVTWQHALDYVAKLNAENYLGHNDWRLPDVNELESLINADQSNIASWLNTQGFTNAQSDAYWSSTWYANTYDPSAWYVGLGSVNDLFHTDKAMSFFVWPVR